MASIAPFHVMKLLARARELEAQGREIIHMEIGEPDFNTPEPIISAGIKALEQGKTHYTPALGLNVLRDTISKHYLDYYGVSVSPSRIVITPGSSGALQLIAGVLFETGLDVLITDPGYPCNRHFVTLMGANPVSMPVDGSTAFQPTLLQLQHAWRENTTIAAIIASPANPTGTLIPPSELEKLVAFVMSKKGFLIVDEIYHGLEFDNKQKTAARFDERVFVINSFSKYFGMTGWRIGWMIAPEDFVPAIDKLAQNIFLAPSTVAQHAALAAFNPDSQKEMRSRRDEFRKRRDYLVPELESLGFAIPARPDGAFYVYADCSALSDDSYSFTQKLLEEAGVAITPGVDFGQFQAEKHVRFAFTQPISRLREGIQRLRNFLG